MKREETIRGIRVIDPRDGLTKTHTHTHGARTHTHGREKIRGSRKKHMGMQGKVINPRRNKGEGKRNLRREFSIRIARDEIQEMHRSYYSIL